MKENNLGEVTDQSAMAIYKRWNLNWNGKGKRRVEHCIDASSLIWRGGLEWPLLFAGKWEKGPGID